MSASWVPPRRTHHLRIFAVSLVLVVLCLAGLLFGVEMEATVPATGTITARELHEVRTLLAGLVEPGWYEGASFHRIQPGDELPPGQVIATIRTDGLRSRLQQIEDELKERESRGEASMSLERARDRLREQLAQAVLRVPPTSERWLVLEVRAKPLQAVAAGDPIAVLVPIDPRTHQPINLIARLDVDEKHWGPLAVGQPVRLRSAVHSHRLHGQAEGQIDRLEPCGEAGPNSERRFHAVAPIVQTPFALPIGSSVQADVVVGRKRVYRIILEH
jgi:hypothetical protein